MPSKLRQNKVVIDNELEYNGKLQINTLVHSNIKGTIERNKQAG